MTELNNAPASDRATNPKVSAVIVIDLQNDFCHSEGMQAIRGIPVVGPQLAAQASGHFVAAARARDVPVFFVQNTHSDDTDTAAWLNRRRPNEPSMNCRVGTWGAEFYHVQPEPHDVVIRKHRYSAFINTKLAGLLQDAGRSSLYFVGVATSVCVETSLRDAVCLDFEVTLVADCCGDYDDSAHRNSVRAVKSGFGDVMGWKQVVQTWDQVRAPDFEGSSACVASPQRC